MRLGLGGLAPAIAEHFSDGCVAWALTAFHRGGSGLLFGRGG
jgi:hypothetical protein